MKTKSFVKNTLEFCNKERVPRQLWLLPWAEKYYPAQLKKIMSDFPDDIIFVNPSYRQNPILRKGNPYEIGKYTDDFGCVFINIQEGVIGEVKDPLVKDEDWNDSETIHLPYEWLSFDKKEFNNTLKAFGDKFTVFNVFPRPFEQLQFIRGTENLYIDLLLKPDKFLKFIKKIHIFYCELLERQAQTDVDALFIMDDWGSQKSLLINPALWIDIFKPLYKEYADIAHRHGKKLFMHSDGNILSIIPHLIEIKIDALNSQIFCMGLENLAKFRGKITFWGEIDRQNLLVRASTEKVKEAVREVKDTLYDNGGCIAQCEFGPGAKPENVRAVFEEWER